MISLTSLLYMRLIPIFSILCYHIIISSSEEEGRSHDGTIEGELDCNMRKLFMEMAQQNIPWRHDTKDVFDALELDSRCPDEVYAHHMHSAIIDSSNTKLEKEEEEEEEHTYLVYVDPKDGNDKHNSGNYTHPYSTIHRALYDTRHKIPTTKHNTKKSIILKSGIHFLNETITLTSPLDNHLTIRGMDEGTWISGGIAINSQTTHWEQSKTNEHVWVANLSSIVNDDTSITGLFTTNPHERMTLARYPNANVEEWDAPKRYIPSFTIKSPIVHYEDPKNVSQYEWIFPNFTTVPEFYSIDLRQSNNPSGHVKNDSSMDEYNIYGTGHGGSCASVWGDEPSYWCSNISAGGWAEVDQYAAKAGRPNIPVGITIYNTLLVERFSKWNETKARGAILHVQHTQGWAIHMFNISHIITSTPDELTIHFDKGGSQGGRNWQCLDDNHRLSDCNGENKILHSGAWYVEGIYDELDKEGEFYYDKDKKLLYFYPNSTSCEGEEFTSLARKSKSTNCIPDLIATNLKTLIKFDGTKEPVKGVTLQNLGFREAGKTYMEQWSAPSGGDWALYRGGAVHLEGTENVTISDCHFRRLDGNAVMISGYNRYAHITKSEFSWIGDGAMATWGDTKEYDATEGNQPRYSIIENNIISNIGLYQKQSSAWGQNKAMASTIRKNVMFNVPRTAINFNDHLGGGNSIEGNVIFSTCRESGDHGAINSWDRMPFLVDNRDGPSFTPLPTHTSRNLIMANYNSAQGFDNDDGSSWFYTHDNVFYSTKGFKMDYGGHSSRFENNLVYGDECYGTGDFLNKDLADTFQGNICIIDETNTSKAIIFGHLFQCGFMVPRSNRYYSTSGTGKFFCGSKELFTLQEMQHKGFELGSTIGITPDSHTIISWARKILHQPQHSWGYHKGHPKKQKKKITIVVWLIVIVLLVGSLTKLLLLFSVRDSLQLIWERLCQCASFSVSKASSDSTREPLLSQNIFETTITNSTSGLPSSPLTVT